MAKLVKAGHDVSASALWTPSTGTWMPQADAEAMASKEGAFNHAARVAELMDGPEGLSDKELCPYYQGAGEAARAYLQIWDGTKQHDVKMTTYGKSAWVVDARRVALAERVIIQS